MRISYLVRRLSILDCEGNLINEIPLAIISADSSDKRLLKGATIKKFVEEREGVAYFNEIILKKLENSDNDFVIVKSLQ